MSLPRRMALLAEAERHGAWILEDDYDGEYQYDQLRSPPCRGWMVRTGALRGHLQQVLFGSLRLAYLVLPRPLMESFCRARAAVDGHSNQLLQAVTADFIRAGHFATHLRQSRLVYQSRRDLLLAELANHCPALTPIHSGAGLQCAVRLPPAARRAGQRPPTHRGWGWGCAPRPVLPGPADAGGVAARLCLPRQPGPAPSLPPAGQPAGRPLKAARPLSLGSRFAPARGRAPARPRRCGRGSVRSARSPRAASSARAPAVATPGRPAPAAGRWGRAEGDPMPLRTMAVRKSHWLLRAATWGSKPLLGTPAPAARSG